MAQSKGDVPVRGRTPLRLAGRLYGAVPFALSVAASLGIVFFLVLICADIFLRYFFSAPINGVTEIVAFGIVSCVFLQLGSTIGGGRLIRADFILGRFERTRPALARVMEATFFAAGAVILFKAVVWLAGDLARSYASGQFTGAIGAFTITLWPFKLAVVIGAAIALAETLRRAAVTAAALRWSKRSGGTAPLAADWLPVLLFIGAVGGFLYVFAGVIEAPVSVGIAALAALLVAVAFGMPIAFALLSLSYLGIWFTRDIQAIADSGLGIAMSGAIRSYEFGVVPLFVMMGLILDKADVGRDAFQVAVHLLRRVRGGLGMATVVANALFAAVTGSSSASAAVFSRIAVPPLIEGGYTKRFAVGVVAGSSVLGMLIPPSLLLIIYGLIAEASIGSLFIAAILPGLLLAFAFAVLNVGLATFFPRFTGSPKPIEAGGMSLAAMAVSLVPIAIIVVMVIGGIYAGMFTPTEAGAVGALGAFLVGLARRKLSWRAVREVILETGFISATILFVIIAANLYGRMLTLSTIPMQMNAAIGGLDLGMAGFLAAYFLVVLLLGTILDSVSIMLIVLPIVLPVLAALGGDPVWFGIVTVMAIEIGLLTPPLGLSVFVVKSTLPAGFVSLGDIFAGAAPFVVAMMLVAALLMAFPEISLALL
ncbi:MAG TPA: TRAP transporter large permease subunit [Afifellaceae bacterium]|nr:TRAP transporter large permease subunit [Afifellaceae bacterium]